MAERLPRTADDGVIGGGANGAPVAFQVAKRGAHHAALLERRRLGVSATGKSGSLVRCHDANLPEAGLALESLRIFQDRDGEVGAGSPGFEPVGFVQVVAPEDEAKLGERRRPPRHRRRRVGRLGGGAGRDRAANADRRCPIRRLRARLRLRRPERHPRRLCRRRPRPRRDAAGRIATDAVVVAASPWANRLLAALGLDLGLVPVRAQVVVFRHRAVIDATRHSWLRTGGTAFALIGAERALLDGDPDRLDETVDAACIAPTRAALAARFSAFAAATMRGG